MDQLDRLPETEAELPAEVVELLHNPEIPREKREVIARILVQSRQSFASPYPPPNWLQAYEKALPGTAERVLTSIDKQRDHRMGLENLAIGSQVKQSNRGQWMAFVIGLTALGSALWLGFAGRELLGGVIGGTTLVGLVVAFLKGSHDQNRDLRNK